MPTREALKAMQDEASAEVFLLCVTIDHPDLTETLRVVANTEAVTRAAGTFQPVPFDLSLPDDDPDAMPRLSVELENWVDDDGDTVISDSLEAIVEPPTVTLEVVMASAPDTVEFGPLELELVSAEYAHATLSGELVLAGDPTGEPYPGDSYNPADWPGLFPRD